MMNKFQKLLLLIVLMVAHSHLFAQSDIVFGRVFDEQGHPLSDVKVCQYIFFQCNYSDKDGAFHVLLDDCLEKSLTLNLEGFETLTVTLDDYDGKSLILTMIYDQNQSRFSNVGTEKEELVPELQKPSVGYIMAFGVESLGRNFSAFTPLLGQYNIDVMNQPAGYLYLGLGLDYKHIYGGLTYGFSTLINNDHDSLNIKFNSSHFGLNLGYTIFETKRFMVTPVASIFFNHFRLINGDKRRKIPIEENLENRNLDIRFNQATTDLGCRFNYKMYSEGLIDGQYWTVGLYFGYLLKVNELPWIYSIQNRLTTLNTIDFDHFKWAINVAVKL